METMYSYMQYLIQEEPISMNWVFQIELWSKLLVKRLIL